MGELRETRLLSNGGTIQVRRSFGSCQRRQYARNPNIPNTETLIAADRSVLMLAILLKSHLSFFSLVDRFMPFFLFIALHCIFISLPSFFLSFFHSQQYSRARSTRQRLLARTSAVALEARRARVRCSRGRRSSCPRCRCRCRRRRSRKGSAGTSSRPSRSPATTLRWCRRRRRRWRQRQRPTK